eukprot:UN34597
MLAVDYRKCPEHPWPGAVKDACQALKYITEYGPDGKKDECKNIILMGDSAGGGLCLALQICAMKGLYDAPKDVVSK